MFQDTRYFTVFGNVLRPGASYRATASASIPRRVQQQTAAASWLVLCALMGGISVFAAQIALLTGAQF